MTHIPATPPNLDAAVVMVLWAAALVALFTACEKAQKRHPWFKVKK